MAREPPAERFYRAYCIDQEGRIVGPPEEIWASSDGEAFAAIERKRDQCSEFEVWELGRFVARVPALPGGSEQTA